MFGKELTFGFYTLFLKNTLSLCLSSGLFGGNTIFLSLFSS
jgi:hypothetical protein